MFSGLVQHLCPVRFRKDRRLAILAPKIRYKTGESIAINGVCLTVTDTKRRPQGVEIWFDLSPETLKRTTLGRLKTGDRVNFERPVTLADFLGGHLVQGHVDGFGRVSRIVPDGADREIWFTGPKSILKYVVPKGSVTVNGVSLTAVSVTPARFSVALIPTTLEKTNLGQVQVGDWVNLEADVLAKYVERFTK